MPDGANTINVETIAYLDAERKETRTDANLHTSEMVYDGLHRLVSLTNADGKTRQLKYDGQNLREESDYKGRFTKYEYDNADRPIKVLDRLGDGQATIIEHSDSSGYTKTVTDRRANKRIEKSDAIGRLLSITDGGLPLMSYEYDAGSNRTAATDGEGHRTEMVYDVLNRLKLKKNGAGSAAEQSETYSYDAAGNLTDYYDERGGHIIQAFDPLNQLKSRKDGEGNETIYNYDGEGLLNWQREPKGDQTGYVYNALRSLKSVTDARNKTWTFAYDAAQNLKSVTDPRTFTTNYDYDNLDRLTKVTQPLGKITLNEYDENSNKVKITDPNGQITDLIPDQLDRTQRVQHKRAVSNTIERAIYYQLDAEGNAFQIDEQITDGGTVNRTYARQFDQRNRLVQTTDYRNKTVRFDYDRANNVTLITDAASKRTGYVYDEQNRVKTVQTNDGESIVYNWYKDGLLKDVNYKNGLKREYNYDNADRVSSIKNTVGVNAQGTQTQEFIYGYDPNSNRLSETRKTDGATSKQLAYNYDELNRLTLSTETTPAPTTQPAPGQSIQVTENSLLTGNGYDAVGNRDGITTQTKVRTITRTANGQGQVTETSSEQAGQVATATAQFDALNRLTNLSENNVNTILAYDNNGNLLSETIAGTVQKRYEYDTRDQLKKVFSGNSNQIAAFDYDFNRHRTSKQTANTNLHYVYAGDEVIDEFDSSSGLLPLQNRYEIGAGEVVKGELRNEPTNYYFSDALGSTTNLSQVNGTQSFSTSVSEYDSFGKINNQTGASANSIGYTGQRLDTETGLMALGNGERYYSPALARFTQQDSVTGKAQMPQSLNRYSYAVNNPNKYVDPSGNEIVTLLLVGAALITAYAIGTGTVRAKAEHDLQGVEQKWEATDARRNWGAAFADATGATTAFKGFTGTDPYKGSVNAYQGQSGWNRVWDATAGTLEVVGNAAGLAGGLSVGIRGVGAVASGRTTVQEGWQAFGAWARNSEPFMQESRAVWNALSHPVQSGRAVAGYLYDSYAAGRAAVGEFTAGGVRATAQRSLQFAKDEILPRFNPRNYARSGWNVDFVRNESRVARAINSGRQPSVGRQPIENTLSQEDINFVKKEFEAIGGDADILKFNEGNFTGYLDRTDEIYIRGDIFPDLLSTRPNSLMSVRAALAHELGHKNFRFTKLIPNSWNDEFRASYWASKNVPGLSAEDKYFLVADAIDRAKDVRPVMPFNYNKYMRQIIYGEE